MTGWRDLAACADEDPEIFFADSPAAAKAVCARCPAHQGCLDEALALGDPWGVRGGLTPQERLGELLLLDAPEPVGHAPSRTAYLTCTAGDDGGKCSDCRSANASYQAGYRDHGPAVTRAGSINVGEQLALIGLDVA